jgi:Alr-MurF fusion protein
MEKLRNVIDPDIGIITNVGDAHRENFPDDRTKASEKLSLFSNCSLIIYCRDHQLIHQLINENENLRNKKLADWSFDNDDAVVFVRKSTISGDTTALHLQYNGIENVYEIPFRDRASIENAITVATACLAIGIDTGIIAKGLRELVSVAMRMEVKKGINNCQLIEDYYNSDPGSLGMALEYLKSKKSVKNTLILSDFVQSGRDEEELYSEVAGIVKGAGIDRFIGIGPALERNRSLFRSGSWFYNSTDDFVKSFNGNDYKE